MTLFFMTLNFSISVSPYSNHSNHSLIDDRLIVSENDKNFPASIGSK